MKLRIRLADLVINPGPEEVQVPSVADKLFELPNDPVSEERVFEGKQLLGPRFEITIKWGFKGAIGRMQKKLTDDKDADSVSIWIYIDSSPARPFDLVEAFVDGTRVVMKGRAGLSVER